MSVSFQILEGDALAILRTLRGESVNCCVTSPPYWGLRDYGTAKWEGGQIECNHRSATMRAGRNEDRSMLAGSAATNAAQLLLSARSKCGKCGASRIDNQLGLEPTPEEYTTRVVEIFREVRRVLRSDGTLWLNLGDSYCNVDKWGGGQNKGKHTVASDGSVPSFAVREKRAPMPGLKPKDLVGIPWRVAFALQADGWWLRSEIIWCKPNPMPESVTDRPTKAHEQIFLLAKSGRYYYDHEAIFEPFVSTHPSGNGYARDARLSFLNSDGSARGNAKQWVPPSYNGSTFTSGKTAQPRANVGQGERQEHDGRNKRSVWTVSTKPFSQAHFATFPPDLIDPCILAGCPEGGTVLDPFSGAGTTGLVSLRRGRNYIGIELNPEYVEMSRRRILEDSPLWNSEVSA